MDHTLPLIDPVLDPCGDRRGDHDWVMDQWRDPRARAVMLAGERVRTEPGDPAHVRWFLPMDLATGADHLPYPGDWVFLGLTADGAPRLAVAATGAPAPDAELVPVRQFGLADPASADLRIVVGGLAVLNWHRRHPRCPLCGEGTVIDQAGWVRRCPHDDSQHFPRVDPAVIMLVVDDEQRALLARQTRWPATWMSTLAGFVEPGETLENAVAREVLEEVGVQVGTVSYRGSQPWPFPSSLMLGFHTTATTTELRPDGSEIVEARWFTRDDLAAACTAGEVRLPPRFSISRWLIELWFGAALPGDWSRP